MKTSRCFILTALLAMGGTLCQNLSAATFDILINHLGYDVRSSKNLVVQGTAELPLVRFQVLDGQGRVAFEGPLLPTGAVAGWNGRFYHQGDFSGLVKPGKYRIQVMDQRSEMFALGERLLPESCLSDLLYYFRIQRCSGNYDKADRALPFFGEPQRPRVDVHGGWYDASGDVSKYIGALNESNYMNVQESPMAVWCFLQSAELLRKQKSQSLRTLIPMLTEEALYAAVLSRGGRRPAGGGIAALPAVRECGRPPGGRCQGRHGIPAV